MSENNGDAEAAEIEQTEDAPESKDSKLPGESSKAPKDGWDKLQAVSPLLTAIVVALIGGILTGSVNQAIQKSQLQFNNVKEMQELLAKLGDPKTDLEQAKTTAVALAAFGSYSVPPLINEIESDEQNRQLAGEYGLRAVALADPVHICPALVRILDNRTSAYNSFTHRAAIRILGIANCQEAQGVLDAYKLRLMRAASSDAGLKAYISTIAAEPAVTRETIDELKSDVDASNNLLAQARQQQQ